MKQYRLICVQNSLRVQILNVSKQTIKKKLQPTKVRKNDYFLTKALYLLVNPQKTLFPLLQPPLLIILSPSFFFPPLYLPFCATSSFPLCSSLKINVLRSSQNKSIMKAMNLQLPTRSSKGKKNISRNENITKKYKFLKIYAKKSTGKLHGANHVQVI